MTFATFALGPGCYPGCMDVRRTHTDICVHPQDHTGREQTGKHAKVREKRWKALHSRRPAAHHLAGCEEGLPASAEMQALNIGSYRLTYFAHGVEVSCCACSSRFALLAVVQGWRSVAVIPRDAKDLSH